MSVYMCVCEDSQFYSKSPFFLVQKQTLGRQRFVTASRSWWKAFLSHSAEDMTERERVEVVMKRKTHQRKKRNQQFLMAVKKKIILKKERNHLSRIPPPTLLNRIAMRINFSLPNGKRYFPVDFKYVRLSLLLVSTAVSTSTT